MYKIAEGVQNTYQTCRGLFVGINNHYMAPLRGCVNDALLMYKNSYEVFGFKKDNCQVLLDERANKESVVSALKNMVSLTGPNDLLRFHISSHGSQLPALSTDEEDGLDEVIVCYPTREEVWYKDCVIRDNELNEIFKALPSTARVVVTLDCCHTGTGVKTIGDLTRGSSVRYLPPPAELAQEMLDIAMKMHRDLAKEDFSYDLVSENLPHCPVTRIALLDIVNRIFGRPSIEPSCSSTSNDCLTVDMAGNVVLYSGCKDIQTSNDTVRSGIPMGAMSASFIESIISNINNPTSYQAHYNGLIASMKKHGDYRTQHPQLEIDPKIKCKAVFC